MRKTILLVGMLVSFFWACNDQSKTENTENKAVETETVKQEMGKVYSVSAFLAEASNLEGKEVTVRGLVEHTCKHGGKKMFILDMDAEANALKITTEKSFDASMEGNVVEVTGVVNELVVNETTIAQLEAEMHKEHGAEGVEEEGHDPNQGQMGQLSMMKKMLEDNEGKEVKSYTLECIDYKLIEK